MRVGSCSGVAAIPGSLGPLKKKNWCLFSRDLFCVGWDLSRSERWLPFLWLETLLPHSVCGTIPCNSSDFMLGEGTDDRARDFAGVLEQRRPLVVSQTCVFGMQ